MEIRASLYIVDVPAKRLISIRHLAGERKILHHSLYSIRSDPLKKLSLFSSKLLNPSAMISPLNAF